MYIRSDTCYEEKKGKGVESAGKGSPEEVVRDGLSDGVTSE